jgi:hypothetical protein
VGDRVCTRREPRILTTCERRSLSPGNSQIRGDGSWAEPLWKTAHRRIPSEGVALMASPSRFSPPPPVPGPFSFRARVILLPDGPTRPMQRLTVLGQAPTFPHPEPPLLFPGLSRAWRLALGITHALSSPGVVRPVGTCNDSNLRGNQSNGGSHRCLYCVIGACPRYPHSSSHGDSQLSQASICEDRTRAVRGG